MTEETNALRGSYQLHEYCIESVLGTGGFGITYKARDTHLETWVAIKEYFPVEWSYRGGDGVKVHSNAQGQVLLPEVKTSGYDWGLDRFLDEARVLARVQHPYVVRVKRYFRANGTAYIVMDYEEGEPLSALLKRERSLAETDVRGMLEEVLPALEAVHREGYLHRDIKPSNLYIRSRDGCVMLIDFGAARQSLNQRSKSITGLVTPGYSPPEQYVTRSDRYGPWTDIYALGAVLYRCVTGSPPTEAPDRQMWDTLEPAVKVGAGRYHPDLLAVIDRALAMRPKERFQSIAEMQSALAKSADAKLAAEASAQNAFISRPSPQMAVKDNNDRPPSGPRPAKSVQADSGATGFQSIPLMVSLRSGSANSGANSVEPSSGFVASSAVDFRSTPGPGPGSDLEHPPSKPSGLPVEPASQPSLRASVNPLASPRSERPSQAVKGRRLKDPRARARFHRNIYLSLVLVGLVGILGTLVFNIYYEYGLSVAVMPQQSLTQDASASSQADETQAVKAQARQRQITQHIAAARAAMAQEAWAVAEQQLQQARSLQPGNSKVKAVQRDLAELKRQIIPLKIAEEPRINMKMVRLPGECFSMGSAATDPERYFNEQAQRICMEDFWISQHEVTNAQYRQFKPGHDSGAYVNSGSQRFTLNQDQQPVVEVSWNDAVAFAAWLSQQTGKNYRLPTEAEWEFAARAKTTGPRYWGADSGDACAYANVTDQTARSSWDAELIHDCDDGYAASAAVGSFQPNKYKLHDMLGNVSEWTCSEYASDYDSAATQCSVQGSEAGRRSVRGGSWDDIPRMVRVSDRDGRSPAAHDNDLGFRLVLEE